MYIVHSLWRRTIKRRNTHTKNMKTNISLQYIISITNLFRMSNFVWFPCSVEHSGTHPFLFTLLLSPLPRTAGCCQKTTLATFLTFHPSLCTFCFHLWWILSRCTLMLCDMRPCYITSMCNVTKFTTNENKNVRKDGWNVRNVASVVFWQHRYFLGTIVQTSDGTTNRLYVFPCERVREWKKNAVNCVDSIFVEIQCSYVGVTILTCWCCLLIACSAFCMQLCVGYILVAFNVNVM